MTEPLWITLEAALAMHDRQLAEHGGGSGIRDAGLLESALARPQNLYLYSEEPITMAALAASYAFGVATNHPFIDGNKRTALVVSRAFLLLNEANLIASQEQKYIAILSLASGEWGETKLAEWFAANTISDQN